LRERLPKILFEICQELEERDIETWVQGDALLHALSPRRAETSLDTRSSARPTACLVCRANPEEVLAALPRAVVTASRARRLTLAAPSGPIDLLPVGRRDLESVLLDFGLGTLALAYRPADQEWCDPSGARGDLENGHLDLACAERNPFAGAPRRYWITARLLAEHDLTPSTALVEAARRALPSALETLPQGAPARRELSRVLASGSGARGLAFLREAGITAALFPGASPANEEVVDRLEAVPGLRWAVWLRGSALQSALVRLRMPIALARRIERIHRAHPIDESVESLRDAGIRRTVARLDDAEIRGLLAWRRIELDATHPTDGTRTRSKRLDDVETRIAEFHAQRERSGRVRALALDGKAVMEALGSGPGPHVGRALAHLAGFIETHPEANESDALARELRAWADKNSDPIR